MSKNITIGVVICLSVILLSYVLLIMWLTKPWSIEGFYSSVSNPDSDKYLVLNSESLGVYIHKENKFIKSQRTVIINGNKLMLPPESTLGMKDGYEFKDGMLINIRDRNRLKKTYNFWILLRYLMSESEEQFR